MRQLGLVSSEAALAPAEPVHAPTPPAPPPLLVVYPDGLANLNGEASRLILFGGRAEAVQLLAPTGPSCPWWLLLAPPVGPGARHTLTGCTDRAYYLRFRSRELATAAFAVSPEGQQALSFQLEPEQPGRYRLLPA